MLLPVHEDTENGVTPGLVGNARPPSIAGGNAPAAANPQTPPAGSTPVADTVAFWTRVTAGGVLLVPSGFVDGFPWWAAGLLWLVLVTVPDSMLRRLIPDWGKPRVDDPHRAPPLLARRPTVIQHDSGDTVITHVPSFQATGTPHSLGVPALNAPDGESRTVAIPTGTGWDAPAVTTVHLMSRIAAGSLSFVALALATFSSDDMPLFARIVFLLFAVGFAAISYTTSRSAVQEISLRKIWDNAGADAELLDESPGAAMR